MSTASHSLSEDLLDELVKAACYCTADLGSLLEWEGKKLVDFSEVLRRETDEDVDNITPFGPIDSEDDE